MVVVVVLDMDLVRVVGILVVVVVGVVVVANHEISYCQKNLNLIFLMKVEESLQRKQQSLKTSGRQAKLFLPGRPFLSWRAFQIRAHSKCWQSHQCQILRESVH